MAEVGILQILVIRFIPGVEESLWHCYFPLRGGIFYVDELLSSTRSRIYSHQFGSLVLYFW